MFKKTIIIIGLSLLLLPAYGGFAQSQETISPTIVIYPDIYYPFDEVLYLEGRARSATAVQINFLKQGSKPHNFNVKSDTNGEWVLAEKISLEAGDWEVRAREKLSNDKLGEWSNPRVFKVIQNGIVIGGISIKFAALVFIIFVLLILGGFIFWYFHSRVRRLKFLLSQKEAAEAHESVREGLAEIKKDLSDELKSFNIDGKRLSEEEIQRKEHILRELDRLEHGIEKEIRDIEDAKQ